MHVENEKEGFSTSRQEEENHLKQTLAVIKDNIKNYEQEIARMQKDIDEMLEHYHDNDPEVFSILNTTVTLHEHMKRAFMRNEKALSRPYFGRIIFHDELLDKVETLYIGRGGISKDTTHQIVIDWRAPVANAYYENGMGRCSYKAPDGSPIKIDLKNKRTYEIDKGKLLDYFDSEVIANDDLLTKYLAKNKQAVLGEIVATIQKEQNEIIRKSPYHNIIVQGVAGSGKTTVAMHRISYILYNYKERFKPDDFYIVGSNRMLLQYITGVLPDLDVYGVRQMTMEQLFTRLLYEDWDESKYNVKRLDNKNGNREIVKGSKAWFEDLEKYCQMVEAEAISRDSVYLNRKQFVEGIKDGKAGVFDETKGGEAPQNLVCLLDGKTIETYVRDNPAVSIQNKINMLNKRLTSKIKDEFLGKGLPYTEAERKAILKAYRGKFGGRIWKRSIYEMYQEFMTGQIKKGYAVDIPKDAFDVYDLAALSYLYKRVKEKDVISEAHHVVIDEAQDFGMMAYYVLKFCMTGCTYTVMGDVSQNIHFGYGLNDWEELRKLLLPDAMDSFGILKKSYRNTVEISDFATNILHHGQFSIYPVEPIIRHGSPVRVRQISNHKAMIKEAADTCMGWQAKGLDTIAIVCRNKAQAAKTAAELKEYVEILESDLEKAVFGNGIMVLPVEYTKG
ncbi:MAG: AAA family ATPase, partial [Lachnospiraceae bacterium]|nr:AAA family ATPase [Lachnospiraceae bacterium]